MSLLAAACAPADPPGGADPGGQGGKPAGGSGGAGGKTTPTAGRGGAGGGMAGAGGSTPAPPVDAAPVNEADGPADAPMSMSADGPPSSSGGCSGKFCEDFEGYAAGGPPAGDWKTALRAGALAVDETKAFSGARSVRFTHNGAPAKMFMELRQPVLPLPGNVVHGRLMYYLTKSPSGTFSHFEIVRGGGPLPGGARAQLNTGAENGKVVINYEPGDCTKYSKVPFPEKRWTCYQWRFDGTKNDVHEWVDGMSADDVPVAPAGQCWKAPTAVDTLHIGWESYHGNQPVELWIDDVAVGPDPIPCPTGMATKP